MKIFTYIVSTFLMTFANTSAASLMAIQSVTVARPGQHLDLDVTVAQNAPGSNNPGPAECTGMAGPWNELCMEPRYLSFCQAESGASNCPIHTNATFKDHSMGLYNMNIFQIFFLGKKPEYSQSSYLRRFFLGGTRIIPVSSSKGCINLVWLHKDFTILGFPDGAVCVPINVPTVCNITPAQIEINFGAVSDMRGLRGTSQFTINCNNPTLTRLSMSPHYIILDRTGEVQATMSIDGTPLGPIGKFMYVGASGTTANIVAEIAASHNNPGVYEGAGVLKLDVL